MKLPRHVRYAAWMVFRFALAGTVLLGGVALVFLGLGSNYSFEWGQALRFLDWYNRGLVVTLELFFMSATLAVSLGLAVALLRLSPWGPLRDLAGLYVHTFRNLPALVVLLLFFFGLGQVFRLQTLALFGREYNNIFLWGVIAFGVYESSYLGETFRAGIQSVHRTQVEAAQSLGMNAFQVMTYVVLPQALRVILPPLTGTLVALVKETALIYLVRGIGDLTDQARQLAVPTRRPYIFEFYSILVAYYLAIVIPLSLLSQWLESRLGISRSLRRQVHHDG